jgi:putative spermidine/putrescine transport system permease protein
MTVAAADRARAVVRDPRRIDIWVWILLFPAVVLGTVFGMPIADLIALSFHEMSGPGQVGSDLTLQNYVAFITDPFFLGMLWNTFVLGLIVVLSCLIIGYPVAYYLARATSRWRTVALFLVVAPLLVSAIVRNMGWFPLLSQSGVVNWFMVSSGLLKSPISLVNNFTGVVIGLVHALLPFMILTLTTVIQRVEPELEEAAANLGAGPLLVFIRVLLPLSIPGVVSGSLLVFTMAVSAYTTPAILGGNRVLVIATYIAQQFRTVLDYPAGATAAALLLVFAALLTALALRLRPAGSESR